MFVDQLDQIDRIMTLPQVVTQINELVDSRTASASDLHHVIKTDPALSAKILRLVNSAYYGLPGRVGSLEKAVILLGVTAVRNLAIAAGVEQLFGQLRMTGPITGRELWLHCLAVATGSRELAQRAGMAHLEEVFMAGIIHDLGLLSAAQIVPQDFSQIVMLCMGNKQSWGTTELEIFGVEHAAAGARLADKWHFPPYMVDMIAQHHIWNEKPGGSDLAGIIYIADTIAGGLGDGFTLTSQSQVIEPPMLERLSLTEQDVSDVWQNLPSYIEELSGHLSV